MSTVIDVDGDLLKMAMQGEFDAIAHGCNCKKMMGAGIAAGVQKLFPEMYKADCDYWADDKTRLGTYSKAIIVHDRGRFHGDHISFQGYNLYTQYNPGRDLRMNALKQSLFLMRCDLLMLNGCLSPVTENIKVGFPEIGCGIAGGSWSEVSSIIKTIFAHPLFKITFVHYKP